MSYLFKLRHLSKFGIHICTSRSSRKTDMIGYLFAGSIQLSLFLISLKLDLAQQLNFSLLYFLSSVFIALFIGRGAGVFAGILASLSVDYHQGPGWAYLFVNLAFIQVTLLALQLLQQGVQNTEAEKQRAEKTAQAREEILSLVAHDLRQPLTTISLRIDLLRQLHRSEAPGLRQQHLDGISKEIHHLDRMIGDLHDLAKIDSQQLGLKTQDINVFDFVTSLTNDFKQRHPKAELEVICETRPFIFADAHRCKQIIENLLSNALKYGDVNREIQIHIKEESKFVDLSVMNYGPGIPAHQLTNIFGRFIRIKNKSNSVTNGLGLGLYISKSLVEAQGGKIWAESIVNKTTCFHVQFQISTDPDRHANASDSEALNQNEVLPAEINSPI